MLRAWICLRCQARGFSERRVGGWRSGKLLATPIVAFWLLNLRIALTASACPPGIYRATVLSRGNALARGELVLACLPETLARFALTRRYLARGAGCGDGIEPVGKRIGALAGDTVAIGPDYVAINGQRLPNSASRARDSRGRLVHLRRAGATNVISFDGKQPRGTSAAQRRAQEIARLKFLNRMGLAPKIDSSSWQLAPNLERTLRERQLAIDIIKSRARHRDQMLDKRAPLAVTTLAPGQELTGRVVGTGLENEARDRGYLMLEGTDGKLHYLRQTPAIIRARGEGKIGVGEIVTLAAEEFEKDRAEGQLHPRQATRAAALYADGQADRQPARP